MCKRFILDYWMIACISYWHCNDDEYVFNWYWSSETFITYLNERYATIVCRFCIFKQSEAILFMALILSPELIGIVIFPLCSEMLAVQSMTCDL